MARDVKVVATCDRCGNQINVEEDFDPSVNLKIIGFEDTRYVVDLCATCESQLRAELEFLEKLPQWTHMDRELEREQRMARKALAGLDPHSTGYMADERKHRNAPGSEKEPCPECGKMFTIRGMYMHVDSMHPKHGNQLKCEFCDRTWPTNQTRTTHERIKHPDEWFARMEKMDADATEVKHPVPEPAEIKW